jgi:FAT domain
VPPCCVSVCLMPGGASLAWPRAGTVLAVWGKSWVIGTPCACLSVCLFLTLPSAAGGQELDDGTIADVLSTLELATKAAPSWAKAWHHWGYFNLELLTHYATAGDTSSARMHIAPAVVGFFRSVRLGQGSGRQGDNLQVGESRPADTESACATEAPPARAATSLKPIACVWSYVACRIGSRFPIWQPHTRPSFQ